MTALGRRRRIGLPPAAQGQKQGDLIARDLALGLRQCLIRCGQYAMGINIGERILTPAAVKSVGLVRRLQDHRTTSVK